MNGSKRWLVVAAATILAVATVHAARLAWVTDDAYISFRYAENLVHGHGLVFNAGERVEGYSNFLWTLWSGLGLVVGAEPRVWSVFWGIAAYLATLGLLIGFTARRARAGAVGLALPVAAAMGAAHRDWAIFATSGLETSMFTFLAVAGWWLLLDAPGRPRRSAAAGLVLALVALSRPDGALFTVVGGLWLIVASRRWRDVTAFALPVLAMLVPYAIWKVAYYGDLLPNTYYAKSAGRAWYGQGWQYVLLYFRKYWVLVLGAFGCLAGGVLAWIAHRGSGAEGDRGSDATWNRATTLAGAFALAWSFYVIRVGGDFMYARMLVPATPFYLVLSELALERLAPGRPLVRAAAAIATVAAVALTPYPFRGTGWVHGIVNEHAFYPPGFRERSRALGMRLRRMFDGLPIRVAFCGGQAELAYESRAPLAIETATGLTDRVIARQPLGTRRGRIGHEKKTPVPYLISRGVHFWTYTGTLLSDTLATYIPLVPIRIDTLSAMVITWDPPVMAALRARGAQVEDFPAVLDRYLAVVPLAPEAEVREVYLKAKRFYFDHVSDPAREAPFRARLGLPPR